MDNKDDSILASVVHLLGLLTGFPGPLIVYLLKNEEGLSRHQAREALNFQITVSIAYIGSFILLAALYFAMPLLALVITAIMLLLAISVCDYVFCIMGAIRASRKIYYRYPVNIRFLRPPEKSI